MSSLKILVLNSGSSSIKYQLFDVQRFRSPRNASYERIARGYIEKIGHPDSDVQSHRQGIERLLDRLGKSPDSPIQDLKEIHAIGHRVVHGGIEFEKPCLVTKSVLDKIRECIELAPLHNPANLAGIEACHDLLANVKQVAVFDTAFHHTIPDYAHVYGLPYAYYEKYNLRKYGFHGTSHHYVALEAARILKKPISRLKLVTCHLGNGCSVTAVKNGRSVDTSMGFTPLEGLVMGTRCGDIDPASVIFLAEKEKLPLDEIDRILNKESGLKGISGVSNDMREIKKAAGKGHARARLARAIFIYRIKKYVGSYVAAMGGVDAVVFTAGIGENEADIRHEVMKGLYGFLSPKKVKSLVIPTNEELMIAKQTLQVAIKG